HIAKVNGRYVVILEGEQLQFERGVSPVEFAKPKSLAEIVQEIESRSSYSPPLAAMPGEPDDTPPWE
ncbi:DUF3898 domain-containing protein, partial [Mesorhizobium sp. M00.F.Ca.ET.186.01.1.1]